MKTRTSKCPTGHWVAASTIIKLAVLTGSMLLATFTRTATHPTLDVAPLALGPFLAASLAIGTVAHVFVARGAPHAVAIAALFALAALLSYEPPEYVDAAIPRTWPAVVVAPIAIAVIMCLATRQAVRLIHPENRITA